MLSVIKKYLLSFIIGTSVVAGTTATVSNDLGGSYDDAKWVIVDKFSGYTTNVDPSKVGDGANPQGQNTTANEGDRISVRQLGTELVPEGDASTTLSAIRSLHTFRKRTGENILMRTYGKKVEFLDESTDSWEQIHPDYYITEADKKFGFADFNINADLQSYVFFGNGYDNFAWWSGAHSNLSQALEVGTSTVHFDSVAEFTLNNGALVACGNEYTYTAISTSSKTAALASPTTVGCDDGKAVVERVEINSQYPKGNIYLVNNNRLFISGVASTSQAVFFSAYGNAKSFATNIVSDSTDTSAGIFNLGEGGGAVTGLAADESSIYMFKRATIRTATLSDTVYSLGALKAFDGKSQTAGAVSSKSIFSGGNGIYFITPDRQIMSIGREPEIDFPQVSRISANINKTVDEFDFSDSSGIVFNDKAFFSFKSDFETINNNTVLVWNLKDNMWDSPVVGWNVSDFAVYDDGNGEALYFGDSSTANVYKVINEAQDDVFDVTANWRSKQFSFGLPQSQKQITDMYVEGYITDSTSMTISLLLDEDGYTQTFSHTITGQDTDIIYDSTDYNPFGLNAFGTKRFGSSEETDGKKKFRLYLGKDFRPLPFYNAQVDFASDGPSQDWEVTSFGIKVREFASPEKRELYKSFK